MWFGFGGFGFALFLWLLTFMLGFECFQNLVFWCIGVLCVASACWIVIRWVFGIGVFSGFVLLVVILGLVFGVYSCFLSVRV